MDEDFERVLKDAALIGGGAVLFSRKLPWADAEAAVTNAFGAPTSVLDARGGFSDNEVSRSLELLRGTSRGCLLVKTDGKPTTLLVRVLRKWKEDSGLPPCVLACSNVERLVDLGPKVLKLFQLRIRV